MRIVIEHDTAAAITPGASTAIASGEAANAGTAPTASAADATGDHDGGGPPEWLLDAVGRTMDAPGAGSEPPSDASDGGAGPTES